MNAVVIRESIAQTKYDVGRNAILQIDGMKWLSPIPENAGDAQIYNRDAALIVEKLNASSK